MIKEPHVIEDNIITSMTLSTAIPPQQHSGEQLFQVQPPIQAGLQPGMNQLHFQQQPPSTI